jgi:hypothetical protein
MLFFSLKLNTKISSSITKGKIIFLKIKIKDKKSIIKKKKTQ